MRLVSCHINGFGAFSSRDFDFTPGINCFLLDNGEGKSTLAAFIKAAFYGLAGYKNNTVKFTDRMHYRPFSGAVEFGGSLVFEHEGSEFRIERTFDKKSDTGDTLTVYRNGVLTEELGPVPGVSLFGVDVESFSKTVFWGAGGAFAEGFDGITPSIGSAMGSESADADEGKQFAGACDAADREIKNLRAKRGQGGLIPERERRVAAIRESLREISRKETELADLYKKRGEIKKSISETEAGLARARKAETEAREREAYTRLLEASSEAGREAAQIASKYPNGVPAPECSDWIDEALGRLKAARGAAEAAEFPEQKREALLRISDAYSHGLPPEEVTARLSALEPVASGKEQIPAEPSLLSLPEAAEAHSRASAFVERAESLKRELSASREEPRPKTPRALAIWAVTAFVPSAAAAVVAAFVNNPAGLSTAARVTAAALAVIAISLAVAAAVVSRRLGRRRADREAEIAAGIREAETGAAGILAEYGYRGPRLEAELTKFGMDIEREREAAAERAERIKRINDAAEEISSILERYGLPDDGSFTGERIRSDIQAIAALTKEEEDYAERKKKAESEAEEALSTLRKIFGLSGLGEPDPEKASAVASRVRTDNTLYAKASADAAKQKKAAEEYLAAHPGAAADAPDDIPDPAELEKALSDLRGEFANTDRDISALEREIDRRPELEEEASRLEEEIDALTGRRRIYELTLEYLKRANASLKDRFVRPVREVFKRHAEVINEILGGSLDINDDFRIQFESGGALHDAKYLSTGQQAVAAVCFRTAVADHIYTESKPFLILDDPFVDLDAENMRNAARLLGEISESYQILYFCAHESRKIPGDDE